MQVTANQIKFNADSVEATASEFIAAGLRVNGIPIDQVGFSVLSKYGVISVAGKKDKVNGLRGKPGSIYRVPSGVASWQTNK